MRFLKTVSEKNLSIACVIKIARLYTKYFNMPNSRLFDSRFQKTIEQMYLKYD